MMHSDLVKACQRAGELILNDDLDPDVLARAQAENPWFTIKNINKALKAIAVSYLDGDKLESWMGQYPHPEDNVQVGLVLAGNIPAVGFHDVLCGFLSGHALQVKLSSKDRVLIPYLLELITKGDVPRRIDFVDRLSDLQAVIATGSDSGVAHFRQYLGHLPHIFRGHRNAVAVLDGSESDEEVQALMRDIFSYFGLGCRNVSKLLVPKGYDFERFITIAESAYPDIIRHNKYANNYDYNKTLYLMNKIPHHSAWNVLITEDQSMHSRIACLHYEVYKDEEEVSQILDRDEAGIQCIVTHMDFQDKPVVPFGMAQQPALDDYADHTDTMAFLTQLS